MNIKKKINDMDDAKREKLGEVVRFGIVGGLATILQYVIYLAMMPALANTILATAVPAEKRTMVVGFSTSFALMGNVAGPMASGAIAMQWGYGMVFWSTAFCFFLAACVIYRKRKII